MSPPKFLPNLSTDGQENATFGAKNTNTITAISKPDYVTVKGASKFQQSEPCGTLKITSDDIFLPEEQEKLGMISHIFG